MPSLIISIRVTREQCNSSAARGCDRALSALLAANRRQLSFVNCCSFEVMRSLGMERAFAFDANFKEQGFARFAGADGS